MTKLLGQEDPPQVTQRVFEIHLESIDPCRRETIPKHQVWIAATAFGVENDGKVRAFPVLFLSVKALSDATVMGNVSSLKTAS